MFDWLAHHPFAVEARLARTLVLTYAVPASALRPLLPPCLVPDTFDAHGFVAAALVQTTALRPQGWPAGLGQDFFLIGYRAFVRYTSAAGRHLRGLYILGSHTDRRRMVWLGNLLTRYGYAHADIRQAATADAWTIDSDQAGLHVAVRAAAEPALPVGSPFETWAQARRFAGPLPFTFSFESCTSQVTVVEGVRQFWQPQPVEVLRAQVGFIDTLGLPQLRLASAFTIADIPYSWKKGRTELWYP